MPPRVDQRLGRNDPAACGDQDRQDQPGLRSAELGDVLPVDDGPHLAEDPEVDLDPSRPGLGRVAFRPRLPRHAA